MPYGPPVKDTVHFVGGTGDKTGCSNSNGGGCTKAAWQVSGQLSDFMGANGGPTSTAAAWNGSETACSVSSNGAGKVRVGKAGCFGACKAGTLANVMIAGASYPDGRYEVLSAGSDYVDLDLTYVADSTCDIKVGGAFDGLQNAADSDSTSAANYNRDIYTNLSENLTGPIDIDTGGGSTLKNTRKRIIGFKNSPGDMDEAGGYYQSAIEAYKSGVDPGRCITYNAQAGNIDVMTISVNNIELRNIYFYNTSKSSGYNGVEFSATPSGIRFVNCKFASLYRGLEGVAKATVLAGCYGHSDLDRCAEMTSGSEAFTATYCVFKIGAEKLGLRLWGPSRVQGCLFAGGLRGVVAMGSLAAVNNTFFDQTESCLRLNADGASLVEFNNLFSPAAADDYAVYLPAATGGTVLYSDYSCAYSVTAGCVLANAWYDENRPSGQRSFKGPNCLEVDPQLAAASAGDFRPRNYQLLRNGRCDIAGNYTQIGAVIRRYRCPVRAGCTNRGRLAIFR